MGDVATPMDDLHARGHLLCKNPRRCQPALWEPESNFDNEFETIYGSRKLHKSSRIQCESNASCCFAMVAYNIPLLLLGGIGVVFAQPSILQDIAHLESSHSKLLQYPTQLTQGIVPKAIHSHNDCEDSITA